MSGRFMIRCWTTIICITDEIYGDVRRILADRYENQPFVLLDLGCGSARHLAGGAARPFGEPLCRLRSLRRSAGARPAQFNRIGLSGRIAPQ